MDDDAHGATIAKRRLAETLSRLRRRRGLTATQVCETLGWGRGKLGRFETNQWKRPEISDIRDLLWLYRIERHERDGIIELVTLARKRPWWREYGDVFDTEYPGFENDAREIRLFSPLTFPVLFQTRRYAELQLRPAAEQGSRLMETVIRRQRILDGDAAAPSIIAVITEAALCYDWGSVADRLEQLLRLITLGGRPNIDLRLHPFSAGHPPKPVGAVTHMRFLPEDTDVVFVDTGPSSTLLTDPEAGETYKARLDEIVQQAYDPPKTAQYLANLSRALSARVEHAHGTARHNPAIPAAPRPPSA
ncbi:helix-turn-helix domain-containing protein [Nonomuraea sp. NPDC050547]|uniref:helix-turn-helix domain-containing protein n=1 Tax=Nonomuraea sp. NPDC050547 TaxID=3364368 RepID=UPI00379E2BA8